MYKPIDIGLLYANITLALHRHQIQHHKKAASLADKRDGQTLERNRILYLEADHVYLRVHTSEGRCMLQSHSLTGLLEKLSDSRFIQTHRSFAVNMEQLSHWNKQYVYSKDLAVPVSRSRRKQVIAALELVAGRA